MKLCAEDLGACVALSSTCLQGMDTYSQPLLDAVDHLCHQVDGDPHVAQEFFGATTPEEMVALAVDTGIFISADDFRALLTSGGTECWLVRGDTRNNPIAHLQEVFGVCRRTLTHPPVTGRDRCW